MSLHMPAYVKNDVDLMRFFGRVEKRTERYPEWRQVFYDCFGMCQYPISSEICGEKDTLEFHEIYNAEGEVCQITLLCNYHHFSTHNGIVNPRHYPSKLQLDVEIEVMLCGGLNEWKKKYKIIDREIIYDFTNDNQKHPNDIQFSENS